MPYLPYEPVGLIDLYACNDHLRYNQKTKTGFKISSIIVLCYTPINRCYEKITLIYAVLYCYAGLFPETKK